MTIFRSTLVGPMLVPKPLCWRTGRGAKRCSWAYALAMRLGPCLRHWRAGASAQWLRQRRQHLNEAGWHSQTAETVARRVLDWPHDAFFQTHACIQIVGPVTYSLR